MRLVEFSLGRFTTHLGRLGLDVAIVASASSGPGRLPRLVVHNVDRALAASS